MSNAKTLLQLAGANLAPSKLQDACLVLIDIQNEYLDGPIAVDGADGAVASAARLLASARTAGTPVFHIAHKGRVGGLFDRTAARGQLIDSVAPIATETVVEKTLPNAFAGTDLQARLAATGRKELILAGFMTHMCVSSTARAALDLGYRTTVVAAACATRDLPDGLGGVVAAAAIHKVALVELSDRFAVIAQTAEEIT
jgi:nicotinamidase-related amidase